MSLQLKFKAKSNQVLCDLKFAIKYPSDMATTTNLLKFNSIANPFKSIMKSHKFQSKSLNPKD